MFILAVSGTNTFAFEHSEKTGSGLVIEFDEKKFEFSGNEKQIIEKVIVRSEKGVRKLLPGLSKNIRVRVSVMDRKVDKFGGVTGRADAPGEVAIEISNVFPGGIAGAARTGLAATVYHEFHHLSRGWTIRKNKFGRGIPIAVVNEGLAVVFSEQYTGDVFEGNAYPKDVHKWAEEIMTLPKDANYQKWMFLHPDGRAGIGYKAGNYIIRRAMEKSGKDVLKLSQLSPKKILKIAEIKKN
jgi:hypothetical protein